MSTPPVPVPAPVPATVIMPTEQKRGSMPPATLGLIISSLVNIMVLVSVTALMITGKAPSDAGMGIIGGILGVSGVSNGLNGLFTQERKGNGSQ